jgi:hypothetical protein
MLCVSFVVFFLRCFPQSLRAHSGTVTASLRQNLPN